jgi:GxxExxY protein
VIGCGIAVHKALGFGLPEICYKKALMLELAEKNIQAESEKRFDVIYKNKQVGYYYADIVIENKIILELKVADAITSKHTSQLLIYLKLANIKVGYVFNFGNLLLENQRLIL